MTLTLVEVVPDREHFASVADCELQVIGGLPAVDRTYPLQPHVIRGDTGFQFDAVGLIRQP
ncbi:hypothetical protein SDC9_131775 [bioreactor metagenome]|uniref:Uncharacterized protein n=1 Tax=bioreactor metagenome TaxID=1076179 RepID=A0A645D7W8_9ZZZZ